MKRARPAQPVRELESITSSLLVVRVLHYASEAPATAVTIAQQLRQHDGPGGRTVPNRILAKMTRDGLLRAKSARWSKTPHPRQYSLTLKGRRLLDTARKRLHQLAVSSSIATTQKRELHENTIARHIPCGCLGLHSARCR